MKACNAQTAADMAVNVEGCALVLEGGGMRASYTAGAVATLLERNINFPVVYGISAGSTHAVNYLSRDVARTRASFVDIVEDPRLGGIGTFLRGRGYFDAQYLYMDLSRGLVGTGATMEYDWDAYLANPADFRIDGFDRATGETITWSRRDVGCLEDLLCRVRASSTMPFIMPPPTFDGRTYMDGGLGASWGIPLRAALDEGWERVFVVRTQPRGYRKRPADPVMRALYRIVYRRWPKVVEAALARWAHYNRICDELEHLERTGRAYVFYPEDMPVANTSTDHDALRAAYEMGYAQAQRDADGWERWLGLR